MNSETGKNSNHGDYESILRSEVIWINPNLPYDCEISPNLNYTNNPEIFNDPSLVHSIRLEREFTCFLDSPDFSVKGVFGEYMSGLIQSLEAQISAESFPMVKYRAILEDYNRNPNALFNLWN